MKIMPDGRYDLRSFATDAEEKRDGLCGVLGHPYRRRRAAAHRQEHPNDYVYSMEFDGDKIRHMTKIWNSGWALKELGW